MEPISTTLACINLAQSLGLFAPEPAPGIGSILNVHFRLLSHISKSLENLHQSIIDLSNDVEELRKATIRVPAEVILVLLRTDLAATLLTYHEQLKAYELTRTRKGIAEADKAAPDFLLLAVKMQEIRNRVFVLNSDITIPALSALIMAEAHCLILGNADDAKLQVALEASEEWFLFWLADDAIPRVLGDITDELVAMSKAREEARTKYLDFLYASNNREVVIDASGHMTCDVAVGILTDIEDATELSATHDAAKQLEAQGAYIPDIFWAISNYSASLRDETRTVRVSVFEPASDYKSLVEKMLLTEQRWPALKFMRSIEDVPGFREHFESAKKLENLKFDEARSRLLAYCGYFVVATSAKDFCRRWLAKM